ncbi:MAG: hypothetical protein V1745_04135 [Patescibacteria group bacterium]
MTKKKVSDIERGAGFFQALITSIMDVAREQNIPFEAIHRLTTPAGRAALVDILDIAYTDYLDDRENPESTDGPLPPDHYRDCITYAPMPTIDELKAEWGKDNVSVIFDGRPFTLHESCQDMDRTPGEKVFYLHDAGGNWESEERIAWGLKQRSAVAPNGYRPANHEETHEFAKAHPELRRFVGLGSFAVRGVDRCVVDVWRDGGRRILGDDWFDDGWERHRRVLFVSK